MNKVGLTMEKRFEIRLTGSLKWISPPSLCEITLKNKHISKKYITNFIMMSYL